ncbi:MAG: cell division protein FtsQ/DivIB [Patescibacteria group bacterium]|nr:cell division protein FtsQ/DivIB [Patescibacteria group bacterium]
MRQYQYHRYNRRNKFLKPKKKKSLIRLIIFSKFFWLSFLILFLLGACFYLFIFYSFFQIKEIKISNNEDISIKSLKNIVEKHIEAKIFFFNSKSIFLVNTQEINQDILNEFPQIDKAKIKKDFPDTLSLTIDKKQAVGIFVSGHNNFYIDKQGIAFKKEEEILNTQEQEILIIKNLFNPNLNLKLREKVIEENKLNQILKIESKLKNQFKIDFKQISIVSERRLDVETIQGWKIYFNTEEDIDKQLSKLDSLLLKKISSNEQQELEYIDLRFEKIYIFPSTYNK